MVNPLYLNINVYCIGGLSSRPEIIKTFLQPIMSAGSKQVTETVQVS